MQLSIIQIKSSPEFKSSLTAHLELLDIIRKMGCAIKVENTEDPHDFTFVVLEKMNDHARPRKFLYETSNPSDHMLTVINCLKEEIIQIMEQEISKGYPSEELIKQREFLLHMAKRLEIQYKKTTEKGP